MIAVLINGSYVFITTYIIGYFTLRRAYRTVYERIIRIFLIKKNIDSRKNIESSKR